MEFNEDIDPITGRPKSRDPLSNYLKANQVVESTEPTDYSANFESLGSASKPPELEQEKVNELDPRTIQPPPETNEQTAETTDLNLWNRFTLNTAEAQASLDRFDAKISNFGKKVEELTGISTLSNFDGDNSIMGKAFRGTLYMGNSVGNALERGAYSVAAFFGADVPRDSNGLIRGEVFDEEAYGFYSLFGEIGAFIAESVTVAGTASRLARGAQWLGRAVEGTRGLQLVGKALQAPSRVERYVSAIDRLTRTSKSVGFGTRMAAKAAEYTVKEATVDFFFQDPRAGRLSDLVGAWAGEDAKSNYLSWLQSDETDTDSEARFKNAVEGMLLEAPFSVVMKGLETGTKMAGSALRGGLGLTDNFIQTARADRQIRKLTNRLSEITDQEERASVLQSLQNIIENPPENGVKVVRAAVAGDLGDGRSPIVDADNDNVEVLFNRTKSLIDSATENKVDRVYMDGSKDVRASTPTDGIFVDVTNEINVAPEATWRANKPVFEQLNVPREASAKVLQGRIDTILRELDEFRGGKDHKSWYETITKKLDSDLKALTDANIREGLDTPEVRDAMETKQRLEQFLTKQMTLIGRGEQIKSNSEVKKRLKQWGVKEADIDYITKGFTRLRMDIAQVNTIIRKVAKMAEASTNPKTAKVAWDLIQTHAELVRKENEYFQAIAAATERFNGLNNSFDLADGSPGKFRKNDFLYGRKDAETNTYRYGVARGFTDITAAIYTALDSPYSGGTIRIHKDGVVKVIDVKELIKNPRKFKNIVSRTQIDQILEGRFNGKVDDNIITHRNLFFEQMDGNKEMDADAQVQPEAAPAPVAPEAPVVERAPLEAQQMAETIQARQAEMEATRKEEADRIRKSLEATEAKLQEQERQRQVIKAFGSTDNHNHRLRIIDALGGNPDAIVSIGGGRSAKASDVAEVLVDTINKNFLEPFRMEMVNENVMVDLGSTDFMEKMVTIATKTIKDGTFARTYLHESFHAVLSVMENSPRFKEVMNKVRGRYVMERGRFMSSFPEYASILNRAADAADVISGKAARDRVNAIKERVSQDVRANKISKAQGEAIVKESYRFVDFDEYLAEILADRGLRDLEYRAAISDPALSKWGKAIRMSVKAVDSIFQAIGRFFGRDNVDILFRMIQKGESKVDITSSLPGSIRMLMGNPLDTSGSAVARHLDYPKEVVVDNKHIWENFQAQRESLKSTRKAIDTALNIEMGEEPLKKSEEAAKAIESEPAIILDPKLATQEDLNRLDMSEGGMNLSKIDAPDKVLVTLRASEIAQGGEFARQTRTNIETMKSQGDAAARDVMQQEQVLFNGEIEQYASSMGQNPAKVRAQLYTQMNMTEKQLRQMSPEDQAMLMAQLRGVMLARRRVMIYAGNNYLKIFGELKKEGKWNGKNFILMNEAEKLKLINAFDALQLSMNSYKLLSGEAGRTLRSLNTRVSAGDFGPLEAPVMPPVSPGGTAPNIPSTAPNIPPTAPNIPPTAPNIPPTAPGVPVPTPAPTPAVPGAPTSTRASNVTNLTDERKAFEEYRRVLGVEALARLNDPNKVQNYVLLMQSVAAQLEAAGSGRFGLVTAHPTGYSFPSYIASNLMAAPISMTRNLLGNTFNLLYMVGRGFAGGLGDTLTYFNAKQGVETMKFWSQFSKNAVIVMKESWGVAKDGWRNNRSYLASDWAEGTERSQIYSKNLIPDNPNNTLIGSMKQYGMQMWNAGGAAVNNTIGVGAKVSSTADEFFKQLIYRSANKAQLMAKFEAQGLRGAELVAKVESAYTELFKSRNAYNVNTLWDRATTNVENLIASGNARSADFENLQQAEFERLYQSVADTYGGGDKNTVEDFLNISRGARKLAERGTFSDKDSLFGSFINQWKYSPDTPAPLRPP